MNYNPLFVVSMIRDMLREMYVEYGGDNFKWDEDPRTSKITIGTVNDIHSNERIQQFPRILIQRGSSQLHSQFITNNLESTTGLGVNTGDTEYYRQDVEGSINIIIESRQEGTCEEIAENTRKFLCWSKPFIETKFGFQAFGKIMQISECMMDQEDVEKFKISINIPYIIEDRWQKTDNLIRLNHVFRKLVPDTVNYLTKTK